MSQDAAQEAQSPKTAIEVFRGRRGAALLIGKQTVGTIAEDKGSETTVEVIQVSDALSKEKVTGLLFSLYHEVPGSLAELSRSLKLLAEGRRPAPRERQFTESFVYVDREEIDELLSGIRLVLDATNPSEKMPKFSVSYLTRGGLSIVRQFPRTNSDEIRYAVSDAGVRGSFHLLKRAELEKLKALIEKSRAVLEEAE